MPQRWPEAAQASKRKQSRAARRRRRKKLSISFTRGTDPPPKSPAMLRPPRASASTAGKQSSAFRIPRRRQPVEHQATISKPPTPAMAAPSPLSNLPSSSARAEVETPCPDTRPRSEKRKERFVAKTHERRGFASFIERQQQTQLVQQQAKMMAKTEQIVARSEKLAVQERRLQRSQVKLHEREQSVLCREIAVRNAEDHQAPSNFAMLRQLSAEWKAEAERECARQAEKEAAAKAAAMQREAWQAAMRRQHDAERAEKLVQLGVQMKLECAAIARAGAQRVAEESSAARRTAAERVARDAVQGVLKRARESDMLHCVWYRRMGFAHRKAMDEQDARVCVATMFEAE